MPRASRISCAGQVWHITHRCHERQFLLKFARDRRRWRHWLFVARQRYGLSILNYVATSNHIHLLLADQGRCEISRSMQLIAGRTAQEFNLRKDRRGAFWEGRYHATAVQTDEHLLQCMTYIDLNMVRAGAVAHPREWDVCGYNEIQTPWQRKGTIDFDALGVYLNVRSNDNLVTLLNQRLKREIQSSRRCSKWTEAVAVGTPGYLLDLKRELEADGISKKTVECDGDWVLRESHSHYRL